MKLFILLYSLDLFIQMIQSHFDKTRWSQRKNLLLSGAKIIRVKRYYIITLFTLWLISKCWNFFKSRVNTQKKNISALRFLINSIIPHRNCFIIREKKIFIVEARINRSERINTSFLSRNLNMILISNQTRIQTFMQLSESRQR